MTTPKRERLCKNEFCGRVLPPESHAGSRCGACAIYFRRNKVERPLSLTQRSTRERA